DPRNPVLLAGQLRCAVSERPMTHAEGDAWGATAVLGALAADGLVRRRPSGWYPAADDHTPHAEVDIRGTGGAEVVLVDSSDGRHVAASRVRLAPRGRRPHAARRG